MLIIDFLPFTCGGGEKVFVTKMSNDIDSNIVCKLTVEQA